MPAPMTMALPHPGCVPPPPLPALDLHQCRWEIVLVLTEMDKPVLFSCPTTGLNVQLRAAEARSEPVEGAPYRMFECLACRGFHLVDPTNGEVMSRRAD